MKSTELVSILLADPPGKRRIDKHLEGIRFGRLVVLEPGWHPCETPPSSKTTRGPASRLRWICVCDCGNKCAFSTVSLTRGQAKSCGCKSADHARAMGTAKRRHGESQTRFYWVWVRMRQRCSNPNDPKYPRYGGRGIRVCERWDGVDGFANFKTDVGPSPGRGYSIDRIDNDGNYEPGNVRWATALQQTRNRGTKYQAIKAGLHDAPQEPAQ